MTVRQDEEKKKTLSLSGKKLELKKSVKAEQIRQSFSHGRSKTVAVEVKRKRVIEKPGEGAMAAPLPPQKTAEQLGLTKAELEARIRLLQEARDQELLAQQRREQEEKRRQQEEEERRQLEEQKAKVAQEKAQQAAEVSGPLPVQTGQEAVQEGSVDESFTPSETGDPSEEGAVVTTTSSLETSTRPSKPLSEKKHVGAFRDDDDEEILRQRSRGSGRTESRRSLITPKRSSDLKSQLYRIASDTEDTEEDAEGFKVPRFRNLKKPARKKAPQSLEDVKKIVREVVIPEVITVQELSNRMAIRAAEVVKKLMSMGVMATINQPIDAETAEIVVVEFGHIPKKVSMADVELGLGDVQQDEGAMVPRAPVVTVMGHVDHGKTSLLDAIRQSDVASSEAGGITQHIGAYQVTLPSQQKITFIDTPGHAAFSEMRARGANITDVVVLVVAADDGIMTQTIEAISHAKAAGVPIVVAINKIDKPEANPARVRNELLNHGLVLEEFGGEVMSVDVSAKQNLNIDKLLEAILIQAEILDLKANPHRSAVGVVVEAKIERGRGAVATVLIQQGTLKVGDIFIAGTEWGRVRVLVDDHGHTLKQATPSMPVEVLGFTGPPVPGDQFVVVETEARAREIAEFRLHRLKEKKAAQLQKSSIEQLILKQVEGGHRELSLIIKSDVQGSVEAIVNSLTKLTTAEVAVRILHAGVGGISESDVTLANASHALIVGFNVRANPQAREAAIRDGVEIRYYSIIYDVIDDVKALLSGMLSPTLKENVLGYAHIREVFTITKVGKIAGCMVTEGIVKRGAKVRLLRDNVVIHEGTLKTLKRFKDEVKEVKEGYECGMAFENYQDIRIGDVIECFEIQEVTRVL
jgi:translation initiation factor IF-2